MLWTLHSDSSSYLENIFKRLRVQNTRCKQNIITRGIWWFENKSTSIIKLKIFSSHSDDPSSIPLFGGIVDCFSASTFWDLCRSFWDAFIICWNFSRALYTKDVTCYIDLRCHEDVQSYLSKHLLHDIDNLR